MNKKIYKLNKNTNLYEVNEIIIRRLIIYTLGQRYDFIKGRTIIGRYKTKKGALQKINKMKQELIDLYYIRYPEDLREYFLFCAQKYSR